MVVSWGKIDNQLKELVLFVEFQIFLEKCRISLGLASDQLTEGVVKTFDRLALVSGYFFDY